MKGYANSSIQSYIRRIELYEKWLKLKRNKENESDTKIAFNYLKHLQKQSNNYRTINRELQPLKLYYKFFRKSNPFQYLYIKKVEEKVKIFHSVFQQNRSAKSSGKTNIIHIQILEK